MADDNTTQVPTLNTVQFESDSAGNFIKSVNLFRGAVSFTKSLVGLPGKANDSSLDVSLSITASSEVTQAVSTWNRDAPTGIVGLGWELPRARITRASANTLALSAQSFSLESNLTTTALIPVAQTWLRLQVSASLQADLGSSPVSPDVVAAFGTAGVRLDASATVVGSAAGPWTITDSVNEHAFEVQTATDAGGDTALDVYDGGLAFELQNYQFYKINYYPSFERWEITTNRGLTQVYGGGVTTSTQGYKASAGNSIEWGVCWGDVVSGWIGAGKDTTQQLQYAQAWNLQELSDRWTNAVRYDYNVQSLGNSAFTVGADGLIDGAEQLVDAGLPYTKACYLCRITDIYGRTVNLAYANKDYTDDRKEYMDPHKQLASASAGAVEPANLYTANAFQDRYETKYLSAVIVANAGGEPLYSLELGYEVTSVTGLSAPLASDTGCKRYLVAITEYNASGDTLPPFEFSYTQDSKNGPNLGALEAITYPSGALGRYTYDDAELTICDRLVTVDSPSAIGADAVPYLWFGPDYVVTVWTSSDSSQISLTVYTWSGRWVPWTTSASLIYDDATKPLNPGSLDLVSAQDAFALSFVTGNTTRVYLYNRDPGQAANWQELDDAGATSLTLSGDQVQLAAGTNFITAIVSYQGNDGPVYSLYRYDFDWPSRAWQGLSGPVVDGVATPLQVVARAEYYLLFTYTVGSSSSFDLAFLHPVDGWQDGGSTSLDLDLGYNPDRQLLWVCDASMAALTVAYSSDPSGIYSLYVLQWDANYAFLTGFSQSGLAGVSQTVLDDDSWPPAPTITNNAMVSAGLQALRYDGAQWTSGSFPPSAAGNLNWISWASGYDFLVQVTNSDAEIDSQLLVYDPNVGSFSTLAIASTTPSYGDASLEGAPLAGAEDWLLANNTLFYRGSAVGSDWQSIFAASPAYALSGEIVTPSMIGEAPSFYAYLDYGDGTPGDSSVDFVLLKNGAVPPSTPSTIGKSSYFTTVDQGGQPNGLPPEGQYPAGPSAFAVYPASEPTFQHASSYTLVRSAADDIQGAITDYPVIALDVYAGLDQVQSTAYAYQRATATCDSTGQVVKYYQSTTYPGCASPSASAAGRTVTRYANGYSNVDAYAMLDGLQTQTASFSGAWAFAAQYSDDLGLDTSATPNGAAATVSAALVSLFANSSISLSARATIQYLQVEGGYLYWSVVDAKNDAIYNIDYDLDPDDSAGVRVLVGEIVAAKTTSYTLYTQRNADPLAPAIENLHGGFVVPTTTTSMQDGVETTTTTSFLGAGLSAPSSSGVVSTSTARTNLAGQTETTTQTKTYASAAYSGAWSANLLTSVCQQTKAVVVDSGSAVTSASQVTEWTNWDVYGDGSLMVPAPQTTWTWTGSSASTDFPWTGSAPQTGWRLRSQVTQRDTRGTVVENIDARALSHSNLYSQDGQLQIFAVSNASVAGDEADYIGFEPYESLANWALASGAALTSSDCHTGTTCLSLPAGASATRVSLAPQNAAQTFVVACWYKTEAGFAAASGAGFSITISQGGAPVGDAIELAFADTGGAWISASVGVPVSAAGSTLGVVVQNTASTTVLVDNVRFAPLLSTFSAQAYDLASRLPVAQIDLGSRCQRTFYDHFYQRVGTVGADGQLAGLTLNYYSRAGNVDGFLDGDPNATIQLVSLESGSHANFRSATGWQTNWTASNAGTNWSVANEVLEHLVTSADTLTPSDASIDADFALYFELRSSPPGRPLALTDDFSLSLGDDTHFTWSAAKAAWSIEIAGATVAALPASPTTPRTWLLASLGETLALWVNGQLVAGALDAGVVAVPTISTGANVLGVHNLCLARDPALFLNYADAAGNGYQLHTLTTSGYYVEQSLHDGRGLKIVQTKSIPGDFGGGASLPAMQVRASLVDVTDFRQSLQGSGVMKGDVADYYDGKNDASDDQDYPYTRTRFEPAPSARTIEAGLAGETNAIIDPTTTSAAGRPTLSWTYGAVDAASLPAGLSLPDGSCRLVVQSDQLHRATSQIIDSAGNTICQFTTVDGQARLNGTDVSYAAASSTTSVYPPNYYASSNRAELTTRSYNPLGQLVSETDPDAGTIRFIYDSGGRVRFYQGADTATASLVNFVTYDAIDRALARGVCTFDWGDGSKLQAYADRDTWPLDGSSSGAATNPVTRLSNTYDGSGDDPTQLGQLVSSTATTPTSSAQVTISETYTWSDAGQLTQRSVTVTVGATTWGPYALGMAYNLKNRLVAVDYPEASATALASIRYAYSGRGLLTGVNDDSGDALAAYAYDPQGQRSTATIGAGTGGAGTGAASWDPAGRLGASSLGFGPDVSWSESSTYDASGTLYTQTDTLTGATGLDSDLTLAFDEVGQLHSATSSSDPSQNLSLSYVEPNGSVDLNGNVQTWTDASDTLTLGYSATGNRLDTVAGASTTRTYAYTDGGLMQTLTSTDPTVDSLTVTYLEGTHLPATIVNAVTGLSVDFGYDARGRRIYKAVSKGGSPVSSRVYLYAQDSRPIVEIDDSGAVTAYVWGSEGLIALVSQGTRYAIACDRLGSPRALVDASGDLVASFGYAPFGGSLATAPIDTSLLSRLYTGMEYDAETGLYNFGARLYDPNLGRFLGPDTKQQYPNAYVYVGNNPLQRTDPSGKVSQSDEDFLAAGLLVLALVATVATGGAASAAAAAAATYAGTTYAGLGAGAFVGMIGGAISGAAYGGLTYSLTTPPSNWSNGAFWETVGIGAAGGAAGGVISSGYSGAWAGADALAAGSETAAADASATAPEAEGADAAEGEQKTTSKSNDSYTKRVLKEVKTTVPGSVVGRAVYGAVNTTLTNIASGNPASTGLGTSILEGVGIGLATGVGSSMVMGSSTVQTAIDSLKDGVMSDDNFVRSTTRAIVGASAVVGVGAATGLIFGGLTVAMSTDLAQLLQEYGNNSNIGSTGNSSSNTSQQ